MKNFSKNLIWILLAFLAISLVFSLLGELDFQEPEKLSMNEVAGKIVKGEVKSITVAGNELDIILNNDAEAVSRKETETGLTETLKNYGVSAEALQRVNITFKDQGGFKYWAGVLLPILLPLLIIVGLFWWIFRRAKGGMNQAMSFSKPNLKLSSPSKVKTTFDDVADLKESKEELKEIIDFLKNPQKFLKMGAKIPRGILLMGRPGTGKTLLARAVAGESRVPFFHISASEFVEMFVGVGASVSEDTPVLIKNKERIELKPISEVVDKYYEKDEAGKMKPVKGIKTLGFKPLNSGFRSESNHKQFFGGSQWSSVEGVYRHKVNELYKIHFLGGTIKTTGDHSVFVRDGNMIRAKEVRELKAGDKLVNLPFKVRSKFVPGIGTTHKVRAHEFEEEKALTIVDLYDEEYKLNREKYEYALSHAGTHSQREIGSHLGMSQAAVGKWQNGSRRPQFLSNNLITAGTPRRLKVNEKLMYLLGLYTAEGRTAQYYTQFVLGLHEKELQKKCIRHISNIFNIEPHTREIPETNSYRITISSPIIAKFFDKYCGTGSKNKRIPEMLWSLSKEHFLAYLRGYADGDGYTTKEGKLSAVSVSKQLITELTWLSSMHGIKAGVRKTVFPAGRKIGENKKPLPETTAWNLIISKSTHPFIKKHQHPFQFKKPIVQKIEKEEYDGYVYDLCGCDNEAFFGGEKPVLLHNSRVRNVFETAKKAAPSIIFIDEIDAIGRQRGAGIGGGHDEREQTLNQILSEMDGFDKETNVIVLGSTNRPDVLDQALLRPGRFDRQVVLDMPDINGREQILQIHSKKKPLADDVDLKKVAVRTPGFSGADLENLMNEAAILAARNGQKKITHEDVLSSIEKVMLGPERKSRVINEEEKKIVAYHEAGHALVAAGIKEADPVQKISIISRGLAGGYTIKLPTEDRRLKTKSKFVAEIAIALGGYMSETMEFGDITTGSSNDIKKSTELVRKLVTQYGMSDKLGPRTFGKTDEMVFLGREISHERDYSEEVAEQIDEEVDKFIQKGLKITQKILKKNKKLLDKIAKTLMEKETIEQEGFNKIIKDFKLKPISVSA